MAITIQAVSVSEYRNLTSKIANVPVWLNPNLTDCHREKLLLAAKRGNELCGIWVVPILQNGGEKIARREFRFFPYLAPLIFDQDNLKRREVSQAFFYHLQTELDGFTLPLHPDFVDLPAVQGLGVFVEWRHTHVFHSKLNEKLINARLRNNISFAAKRTIIEFTDDPTEFRFDIAIKGKETEIQLRKELALSLLKEKKAIIAIAKVNSMATAGMFIVFDQTYAQGWHSWKLESAVRGVMSLIIKSAVDWVFDNTDIKKFDLEGSVIQDIDYFYTGFNAQITPYPFVYWAKSIEKLFEMLNKSINIEGRLIK